MKTRSKAMKKAGKTLYLLTPEQRRPGKKRCCRPARESRIGKEVISVIDKAAST